jgi:nitrate/nitrite transporter NarK
MGEAERSELMATLEAEGRATPPVRGHWLSTLWVVVFLRLSIGSFLGRFGPFWALPTDVLPPAVAGVGIGLINGLGNIGAFVSPYFFGSVRTVTGSFTLALMVGGISLIVVGLVAIPIGSGRRRDRADAPAPRSLPPAKDVYPQLVTLADVAAAAGGLPLRTAPGAR